VEASSARDKSLAKRLIFSVSGPLGALLFPANGLKRSKTSSSRAIASFTRVSGETQPLPISIPDRKLAEISSFSDKISWLHPPFAAVFLDVLGTTSFFNKITVYDFCARKVPNINSDGKAAARSDKEWSTDYPSLEQNQPPATV
jgi:hypothetical protein